MSAVTDDIAADFIVEAQEIVDRLGEQLVDLEHAPGEAERLNAVFRAFHTIKGGAGFLDLPPMVALCHVVEDALNLARSGEHALSPADFDAAQQAVDGVRDMLASMTAGTAMPEAAPELIAYFKAIVAKPTPPGAAPAAKAAPAPVRKPQARAANDAPAAPAEPPEATVRVDTRRLDAIVNLVGELVLARNRLKTLREELRDERLERAVGALDIATSRLQSAVMKTRMQPVGRVFARFPKLARDVARSLGKDVDLQMDGVDTELDRNLVETLADPLVHLVRNAIDHGIEDGDLRARLGKPRSGTVRLKATQEGDHVTIEVSDDGAGIDPERLRAKAREKGLIDDESAARLSPDECLQLVFLPGFSTKAQVSDLSGRGVGMDVVQSKIRELSGEVRIQSEIGRGSRFLIRVPLTLAILPTLLIQCGEAVYALPLARVTEVMSCKTRERRWINGCPVLDMRERPLQLLDLRRWLGLSDPGADELIVVVLEGRDTRFGLIVDAVRGREEIVIKPLPRTLRGLPGYAGATLIGDGSLALILDIDGLPGGSSNAVTGR
ncbi:chemotaxis protein CheA [Coralloluteibacterium stylophorae]|uniref:Chemotaxis protein CheA n=1 Tax=Coralloluteibacterium stylophorae TaxID=1776034 RepID=A0A8J7VUE7_9GAMM|nr:chemotaxis protein CheA [Coralloluteibacterium stylophorae]MBS7457245.1 chemotaxis protein CheA [Coralloluteibacterium stylophorae]